MDESASEQARTAAALEAERAARREAEAVAARLGRLESLTEAALARLSLDQLLDELLVRLRELVDVDSAAVLLLEGETGDLVARAAKGLEEEARRDVRIPLVVEGTAIGVLQVGPRESRELRAEDMALLQLAADRIALAIDHARLHEAERSARMEAERAAERIGRLESITEVALSHLALDDQLLDELLARVRDNLEVDTAAILQLDRESNELLARAAKGLEEEVERRVRIPMGGGFAGRIAATAAPVVIEDVHHRDVLSPILRARGVRSLLGVPLLVEGRVTGVLHVGSLAPRSFSAEDIALLQLAADRIAVALDHARLFEREHLVARTLQRSLLPQLPRVAGLELAARYRPGAGETELGGDWYDAVVLPSGHLGIALGDVVSRGVRAASVTAQLRNALRAYALDGHSPAVVLDRLSALTRMLEPREMATLVYMVVDPGTGGLVVASAGHPPPLVVEPGGRARFVEAAQSVPLGALPQPLYEEIETRLEPGATLMAYTDGLVERRDMWMDEGMERLRQAAEEPHEGDLDDLCDGLLGAMLGESPSSDDVALIAFGLGAVTAAALSLEVPAEADELSGVRRALRQWLAGVGAEPGESYEILVATTEAAANAVEHAYGPVDATFRVEAAIEDGDVAITVRDTGSWRPPRGTNRGRGTLLMQQLMDAFEVVTGEDGTEVRMRRRLGRESEAA